MLTTHVRWRARPGREDGDCKGSVEHLRCRCGFINGGKHRGSTYGNIQRVALLVAAVYTRDLESSDGKDCGARERPSHVVEGSEMTEAWSAGVVFSSSYAELSSP